MEILILLVVVVPIVVMTGALFVSRLVGDEVAKLGMIVWIASAILVVVSVLGGTAIYLWQDAGYRNCLVAVNGRNDFRTYESNKLDKWRGIQKELDEKSQGRFHLDSIDALIAQGEKDLKMLPARSKSECPKPLTLGG